MGAVLIPPLPRSPPGMPRGLFFGPNQPCPPTTTRLTRMRPSGCATSSLPGTSRQASWTKGALKMFTPPTCADSSSAISSPALASGAWPCAAPAGPMTDLFGPVVVRANLSARQAKDLGLMTSGTFGPPGTGSSKSAALAQSLANRFQTLLERAGWTSPQQTSKAWDTPSGRSVFDPQTSVSPSAGGASTLLPSISAREWRDSSQAQILARLDRGDGVAKRICALSPTLRSSQEIVGLNPLFAAWTMSLPPAWGLCMPSATPSTRKRRKPSSAA